MKNRGGPFRIVVGVLGLILVVTLFPTVLTGFMGLWDVAASQVDTADNVTTAVAVTTCNVTLTQTLLNSEVANVASITSTIGGDVAVADNYTSPLLYLTGLTANVTAGEGRTLTTTYDYGIRDYFVAFPTVITIAPVVLFLSMIFGSGYLVVSGARKYRKN